MEFNRFKFFRRYRGVDWAYSLKDVNIDPRDIPASEDSTNAKYCPELQKTISFAGCLGCERYQIWHERDEAKTCWYEFQDLKSRGYYDGTWDFHPENFEPDEWEELERQRETNERVNREIDEDWERLEQRRQKIREMLEKMDAGIDSDFEEDEEEDEED
jgi:uncharacterized coiled-coil protein SlyX